MTDIANLDYTNTLGLEHLIQNSLASPQKTAYEVLQHGTQSTRLGIIRSIVQPKAHIRPHCHPNIDESYIALQGSFFVVFFNDAGNLVKRFALEPEHIAFVRVRRGEWHTVLSRLPDSALISLYHGVYNKRNYKEEAPFLPKAGSPEEDNYFEHLKTEAIHF